MSEEKRLLFILPAYCPEDAMTGLVRQIRQAGYPVLVVDDGSGDAYLPLFEQVAAEVTLLRHTQNRGKGAAMKTAFSYVLHRMPEVEAVVTVDADGQHLFEDAERVLNRAVAEPGTIILGCRDFELQIPWRSKLGNKFTRTAFELASGLRLTDTQTGLRAFSRDLLPLMMEISGDRYEYETNQLLACGGAGVPIEEEVITTVYTDQKNSVSHFHPVRDSMKICGCILRHATPELLCEVGEFLLFVLFFRSFEPFRLPAVASEVLACLIASVFKFILRPRPFTERRIPFRRELASFVRHAAIILAISVSLLFVMAHLLFIDYVLAKLLAELMILLGGFVLRTVQISHAKKKKEKK